jgi:hypothetical protein
VDLASVRADGREDQDAIRVERLSGLRGLKG